MDIRDRLQATLGNAYTVERELGGGGMSHVFVAEEASLGRRVVVKVLPPDMAGAVSVERFKREIALAARLQHPHIVPLLSAGEMDGVPYFTMPFVEGESLRVRLAHRGELPIAEAMRVLRETASALAYAHERGVVHRDIKPDNILLSGGAAMVTDFGVTKALVASGGDGANKGSLTSMGVALGTPAYMAPEQASADPTTDHRADIYALGCVAYELLSGQPPFAGRSPQAMLAAHVQEEPDAIAKRRPNLPPALAALVMRCLSKRPADRPQTAAEVVHALDDITTPSGGMQPTSALPATQGTPAPARWTPMRSAVLLVGIFVAVGGGLFAFWKAGARVTGPADVAAATTKSVAVLPFVNVGADTANEYFADGMTDEVTSALGKIGGLRVASRTSAFAYKGQKGTDVRAVGKALNVGSVLEGTVRRSGTKVRITAQLANTTDGLAVWSDSYERDVKDIFVVQDELARAIASALRVSLSSSPSSAHHGETSNAEAHDLYLRAEYVANKYDEPSLYAAIKLYQQAIDHDPRYSRAWAGIGNAWGRLADDFIAPSEATLHVKDAIERAAAIDSLDPEVHAQRAIMLMWFDWDIPAARREFSRALELDPGQSSRTDFVNSYSILLDVIGQRDSARAIVQHLANVDPANPQALANGANFVARGDTALGLSYCDRLRELNSPDGACEVARFTVRGQYDTVAAIYAARRAKASDPRERAYNALGLARAYAKLGRRADGRAELDRALAETKGKYIREDQVARTWLALGESDSTFAWLEKNFRSRGGGMFTLPIYATWAPIRSDPRYKALLERAGIAPYVK